MFESEAFRDAFMAEWLNCAAFPNGQYVFKRYKKSKIDDFVKLFNSLEEHTRKSVQMSKLARNFAKQFSGDALSEFEGFTYEKVFYGNVKRKNEFVTIEKCIMGVTINI